MNYPNELSAVTVTTTSVARAVGNDEHISFIFLATNISSGNGVFSVDVMIGGTWVTGVALIDMNVSNTNAQNLTRVTSVTISSNTQKVYALDQFLSVEAVRIVCTVTTDGKYSAHIHTHQRHK